MQGIDQIQERVCCLFAGLFWESQTRRKTVLFSLPVNTLALCSRIFWHCCDEFLFRNDFRGRRRSLCVSCSTSKAPACTPAQQWPLRSCSSLTLCWVADIWRILNTLDSQGLNTLDCQGQRKSILQLQLNYWKFSICNCLGFVCVSPLNISLHRVNRYTLEIAAHNELMRHLKTEFLLAN